MGRRLFRMIEEGKGTTNLEREIIYTEVITARRYTKGTLGRGSKETDLEVCSYWRIPAMKRKQTGL